MTEFNKNVDLNELIKQSNINTFNVFKKLKENQDLKINMDFVHMLDFKV